MKSSQIKAHCLSEQAIVGACHLTEARPWHPTSYMWPPTALDEAPHFTEAVRASFLCIRATLRHPQDMIERDEESNINEEISSYNPGRVQDGGYMNKVRNQIGVALMESRNV
ncbi:hypothetical protein MTR_5g080460 [Medicago truncatula]|uniref:Uncharacterized protein n=1 Tax=Medicago truncatula TaxID=3880 RepID=G7KGT2_MEDTR|nr:hypothetical protein MTR_5g080460 [Medicago truncatula]